MKNMLKVATAFVLGLGIMMVGGLKFSADTIPIVKCTITITKDNSYTNSAQSDGPCQGLETGYYQAEQNQFNIMGLVVMPVNYSGQKFTLYLPQNQYNEAELTVYTTSTQQSGNTTNPTPTIQKKIGWVNDKGTWYFYNSNGMMKTGWEFTGGKWYFLQNNGAMKTGWVFWGGKWYFLENSGAMKTGWVYTGKWYFLDNSGAMKTGWVYSRGKWYYLDNSGAMKTGRIICGGKSYFLDQSGAWNNK